MNTLIGSFIVASLQIGEMLLSSENLEASVVVIFIVVTQFFQRLLNIKNEKQHSRWRKLVMSTEQKGHN